MNRTCERESVQDLKETRNTRETLDPARMCLMAAPYAPPTKSRPKPSHWCVHLRLCASASLLGVPEQDLPSRHNCDGTTGSEWGLHMANHRK